MLVTIGQSVYAETVNDEIVLLELSSGQYFGLNPVGSRLWTLIAELSSTDAVIDTAVGEYNVTREELARDLERLIHELAARNLVVILG